MNSIFCVLVVLGMVAPYRVPEPWSAKYVLNYTAHYPPGRGKIVSWTYYDVPSVEDALSHDDCERTAFLTMQGAARRLNPGAVKIDWQGWSGRCWQGAKPEEPLAWSIFAHGKHW